MLDERIIVCDKCENEFRLRSVDIHETKVVCQGDELTLVYFTCPKRNEIYRVCLKDEQYGILLEDLEKTKKRIRRNFGSNNIEFARTLDSMVLKKQERLKSHTKKLNAKYGGTFTFAASENKCKEQTNIIYLP